MGFVPVLSKHNPHLMDKMPKGGLRLFPFFCWCPLVVLWYLYEGLTQSLLCAGQCTNGRIFVKREGVPVTKIPPLWLFLRSGGSGVYPLAPKDQRSVFISPYLHAPL